MNANKRKSFEQLLAATRGVWRGGDGLEYQLKVRAEWDDRAPGSPSPKR
jgi:hypothetical protein